MASTGIGSPIHVAGELFKMMADVNLFHVPYRGDAPALTALLSGEVQMTFGVVPASLAHIKAGALRALAVTTAKRQEVLPDVPAMGEFLPGYQANGWYGVVAPKATPSDIIDRLNREINAALTDAKMRERLARVGMCRVRGVGCRLRQVYRRRNREVGRGGEVRGASSQSDPGPTFHIIRSANFSRASCRCAARACRRSDRVSISLARTSLHLLTAAFGTFETSTDVRYSGVFGG